MKANFLKSFTNKGFMKDIHKKISTKIFFKWGVDGLNTPASSDIKNDDGTKIWDS